MGDKIAKWFRKEAKHCLLAHLRGIEGSSPTTLFTGNRTAIIDAAHAISLQYRLEEIASSSPLTIDSLAIVEEVWLQIVGRSNRPTWSADEIRRVLMQRTLGLSAVETAQATSTSLQFAAIQSIFGIVTLLDDGEPVEMITRKSPLIPAAIITVRDAWIETAAVLERAGQMQN